MIWGFTAAAGLMALTLPLLLRWHRVRERLAQVAQVAQVAQAGAAAEQPARAISGMNAAELAALNAEELPDEDAEQAFQAALGVDAREIAGRFAQVLAHRPPRSDRPDRYTVYNHLVQLALENDQFAEAQSWIDAGLKEDCEYNEGRRRNDYELRRAQAHLRANEPEQAQDLFRRLIERVPSDLHILGVAAEAMLSARRPQDATAFAEQGLTKAKGKGDRDHAAYFEELLTAAKKM
jgi:tetratricopeptide (TPR) repeat protein